MASLTNITLHFDNNVDQTITVGPHATFIDTPFGRVQLAGGAGPALTPAQIRANPGAYDGTMFDITTREGLPALWNNVPTGMYVTWGKWYAASHAAALEWISTPGVLGGPPDLTKLTAGQKARMGIK